METIIFVLAAVTSVLQATTWMVRFHANMRRSTVALQSEARLERALGF